MRTLWRRSGKRPPRAQEEWVCSLSLLKEYRPTGRCGLVLAVGPEVVTTAIDSLASGRSEARTEAALALRTNSLTAVSPGSAACSVAGEGGTRREITDGR